MARIAVTADYYSVLGVSPAAEDVVIRAAYRALIRHYHPDTNPDPEAQARAREITAAFAVLRDPARRAQYDAERSGGRPVWIADEVNPPLQRPPPAGRGLALASVAVAMALVAAVLVLPQPGPPPIRKSAALAPQHAVAAKPKPIVELEPESARLAKLGGGAVAVPAPPTPVPLVDQPAPLEQSLKPVITMPAAEPSRIAVRAPKPPLIKPRPEPAPVLAIAKVAPPPPKVVAPSEPTAGCRPGGSVAVSVGCKNERLATLDRMAAGFFSQSMAHADAAKKQLLLSSHTRSAETRSACRSDACVGDAYLRQMREISAIMEGRAPPAQ